MSEDHETARQAIPATFPAQRSILYAEKAFNAAVAVWLQVVGYLTATPIRYLLQSLPVLLLLGLRRSPGCT